MTAVVPEQVVPEQVVPVDGPAGGLDAAADRVGVAAAAAADEVDRDARFPAEAAAALRADRLLSLLVPVELGGSGASLSDVARVTTVLGRSCSSTALIHAMHHIQVACLVRHGDGDALRHLLRRVASEQLLLASATTEVGIGGDTRSSTCALTAGRIDKQAPVISYGEHADAVLVTARRTPDSPADDQVLAAVTRDRLTLTRTGEWNTLGFRGTCSNGFVLGAEVDPGDVLTDPFAEISQRTMLPVSHVLWAAAWLGMADEAVRRASLAARRGARKTPDAVTPAASRLAELSVVHQQLADLVETGLARVEAAWDDPEALARPRFTTAMNNLKLGASALVAEVVTGALAVTGIAGYREDSEVSLGRLLRDAYGAGLMVSNDRILANNARMLLASRGPR